MGSIDEIADIWAMIQEPMLTQESKEFKEASSTFFDGAAAAEDGSRTVAREKVDRMLSVLFNIPAKKLRKSEQDALDTLFQIIQSREEGAPIPRMTRSAGTTPSPGLPRLTATRRTARP